MMAAVHKHMFLPLPLPLTTRQWIYLVLMQGLGAGIIAGGVNFAIAFAMYRSQDLVRLWPFKNTIAGDLGVTALIQCGVSMVITSTLVHTDLHNRAVAPFPFVYPHVEHLPDPRLLFSKKHQQEAADAIARNDKETRPVAPAKRGLGYYWHMLMRFIFEGTEKNILLEKVGIKAWIGRLIWTALQGLGIGIIFGFPLWCLSIVILGPIYKLDNLGSKWAPQVIKFIYAFLLGILTNPVMAILALGSQAEHHLIPVALSPTTDSPSAAVGLDLEQQLSPTTPPRRPFATLNDSGSVGGGTTRTRPRRSSSLLAPPIVIGRTDTPLSITSLSSSPPPPSGPILLPPSPAPAATPLGRPRAYTASSSTGSVYSLGGAGGRAQRRPRAGSRASILPTPATPSRGDQQPDVFDSAGGAGAVSVPRPRAPVMLGSERGASLVGGDEQTQLESPRRVPSAWMGGFGAGGADRLREQDRLETPRESGEYRLAGRIEGEVGSGEEEATLPDSPTPQAADGKGP